MDPLANWEELVELKNTNEISAPVDEDLNYYFQEYKEFDNLFDEALTTLQDLDVPSGYGQAQPPQRSPRGSSRSHTHQLSHFRHLKKPSGTAIFGFLDHNRELSLGGTNGEDYTRMMKQPQDNMKSISPTQLARSHPVISNEQLDFNFDQPLEACKPIELNEEDENEETTSKKDEDIIVTNRNPKLYKFPPDPPDANERATFELFLGSSRPLQPIHHPNQNREYPDDIDDLSGPEISKRRYVPIPVHEPAPIISSSPNFRLPRQNAVSYMPLDYSPHQDRYASRSAPREYPDALSMNMNVFLPPPLVSSLSQASPEPHSPLPQHNSSPLRRGARISPFVEKRTFYNPQFFSDDAECYYPQPPSQFGSSPTRELPQSSPIRQMNRTIDNQADETIIDANETILQLTPLKNQAPITPRTNGIKLEWSPIISPNGKTKDVRKAIQELSPRRTMKKTSLLPPGELDKYWEGPDDDKNFTCVYQNCGKKFTRRYNVRSHIQTHLSDRPFTCLYCPKSFVRQHDLNRHVKSHMVSKHCRCKCGREFTRIEGYKKHLTNGVCVRPHEENSGISKPGAHRTKGETILDGLTSNRLNEELNLAM